MKKLVTAMSVLCLGFASLAAQDTKDRPQDTDRARDDARATATDTTEVRVYVWDKEKKAEDLKDMTASLMVEEKPGVAKKTVPMQLVTPRAADKADWTWHGQTAPVEGTSYTAELVVAKGAWMDRKDRDFDRKDRDTERKDRDLERKDRAPGAPVPGADRRPEEPGPKEPAPDPDKENRVEDKFKQGKDRVEDKTQQGKDRLEDKYKDHPQHTGAYFKADLGPEYRGWKDATASVVFTIKGEQRTASGFKLWTWGGGAHADYPCASIQGDLRMLEQQISGHDMEKAQTTLSRMISTLQTTPRGDKHAEECMQIARDLQTNLNAGNRDKAMDLLDKCKKKCQECAEKCAAKDSDKKSDKKDYRND